MQYNKVILATHLGELINSMKLLFDAEKRMPTLILLFSTIDILANLYREENHSEVVRSDFYNWCDTFMNPDENLGCSSKDLYSARCSILHSYTAYSRMTSSGEAKQLWYSWGKADSELLNSKLNGSEFENLAIVIPIEKLLNVFEKSIFKFAEILDENEEISNLVFKRAEKLFSSVDSKNIPF